MKMTYGFRLGFALVFVLLLVVESIALLGDQRQLRGFIADIVLLIGIGIAGELLLRATRRKS